MKIRPATVADIPTLAQLMADDPLWLRYGVTKASAERRLSAGLAEAASIAVAEEDGAPAGFIWFVARGAFARSGYIMLLGVQPWARGRGVGRALLEYAETTLFAQAPDIFLLVSDFNRAAQAFYRRLGYEQVGAIPGYVVDGVTELIFRKRRR